MEIRDRFELSVDLYRNGDTVALPDTKSIIKYASKCIKSNIIENQKIFWKL